MGLEKIDLLKKELNLTSKELSEKSGVPLGTLNKILSGVTKDPKLETLKSLARVLGCTLDYFDDKYIESHQRNVLSSKESKLINAFNQLNQIGKDEAIKRVFELTEINKYTTYSIPLTVAAHDDDLTDAEKTLMDERINEALKKL